MVSSVEYFSKKRGVFVVLEDFNFNDVKGWLKRLLKDRCLDYMISILHNSTVLSYMYSTQFRGDKPLVLESSCHSETSKKKEKKQ